MLEGSIAYHSELPTDAKSVPLQDYSGIVEKSELAAKVKQAASQGPEGQAHSVPVGYAYETASGNPSLLIVS